MRGPVVREQDLETLHAALERGKAMTKPEARALWGWNERRFRATVSALRAQGYPVISASDAGSRYRKAKDSDELEAFITAEIESRANDLIVQARQLRRHAPEHFGRPWQPALLEVS